MAGRKDKYDTHVHPRLFEVERWARDGLTEVEMCKRLGVAVSSFNKYKNKSTELTEALKKGKAIADYEVEDSLFKRALGYRTEEKTYLTREMDAEEYSDYVAEEVAIWNDKNPDATREQRWAFIATIPRTQRILEKVIVKDVVADTTAAIFWLKNRKPEEWRDKQDIEHSGGLDIKKQYAEMSDEELEELTARYEKVNRSD